MPTPKPTPRLRLHLAEWLGLWLLLLALGGYIGYSEYLNYLQTDVSERERLASQALVIEKNLAAQLFSADRALQALSMELARKPSKSSGASPMDERLKLISDTLTGVSTVLVTNARGKIIHSNVASLVGFDTSGRDYFKQALKQRRQDLLFVSAPFTSALGKTSISLVREITGAHGEFGGVVLAALDPAFFAVLLDSIRFTPDTNATLVHGYGKVFMNAPANAMWVGRDLAVPGSLFTQHKASDRPGNLFVGVTYLTGDARMIAFQTVQPPELAMDKPLVVAVLRESSAIHANWRREATQMAWLYAGLCLMVSSALFFYQQRSRGFQRLAHAKESALRDSDARLRSFFETTPDALLISDSSGTITMANQQVEALLGYSMEELVGKSIDELVPMRFQANHPKLREGFAANASARRMSAGMAVKALRKDGSECDVEVSLSRIVTDEGQFFASALRDISERKRIQDFEAFRARTLELLTSDTPLRSLLEALARGVEQVDPSMLCSILLLSSDGQRLGQGIAPSLPDFYNAATDCIQIGVGVGSCGTAAFTGQPIDVEDIASHPYWANLKPLAAQAGLAACWSQAILSSSGQVLGTLGIYHRTVHTQTAADMALVEQAAHLVSIAIEKRRNSDRLIASEHRFRKLTEMSSDFYWESDSAHRLTQRTRSKREMADPAFLETALIGQFCWEVPHRSPDAAGWLVYRALFEAHLPIRDFTISRFGTDGAVHYVSVSGDPIFNASGEFTGYQGVGSDITDQSLALESLQASDAFSLSILDSVGASVAVTDRAGLILRVNQAWLNFALDNSGLPGLPPPGTGVGSNYFSVCTDSAVAPRGSDLAARRGMQQVLDGSLPSFALEYPCHSPTRQRWFMMNVTPLGPHAQYGLVISHTDISQLKLTQEQLRIAAVAFESELPTVVADNQGVVLRVNRAFVASTGFAVDDIVGQTPHMLQSGRHDKAFYRSMWRVIKRTGNWQGEIWDRRKNGEVYPKWLTISAVRADDGVVTQYVGTHQDSTERMRATERIRELAFYDQLTGLPNRTLLADRLKQTLTGSSRSGICGALLFIDLDHFKTLNDTQGHDIGDMQLKQVAARLSTCVREGDTVARVGGDEFVVILAGLSKSEIEAATGTEVVATKILAALNQPYPLGELSHSSSASIGATLFRGTRASIDDLMKQADMAMYRAKDAGRNAVRFFDPGMETAVVKRVAMEKDLRFAVEGKQFVLNYQAQVEAAGGVTGAEVLVRWQHPQQGMVSPADFIPLAEETGVILALGHWVLETACSQLKKWAQVPSMEHLTLAVNVSALQFAQDNFVQQVMAVVQRTGAKAKRLKLELTESLLVGNVVEIIEKMELLKASGISFSLDDFGTGYSSLAYLSRLPLDQLKIDKSFVNDVVTNPDDASIARTIIALAHSLRLGVIAEGVETDAQREFLASAGCHAFQGYFFGRPLPLEDFEAFVRNISLPTTAPAI